MLHYGPARNSENPSLPYAYDSRFAFSQRGHSDEDAKQGIIDAHAGPYIGRLYCSSRHLLGHLDKLFRFDMGGYCLPVEGQIVIGKKAKHWAFRWKNYCKTDDLRFASAFLLCGGSAFDYVRLYVKAIYCHLSPVTHI